ncbi:hypothetical protein [Pseudoalteromonas umbrosa]|uniref:hypothetical protein n=1 Tax=Pseudoalteromonas umbrosa TaxID=3048489 RepID=UPI0024C456E8|nr:hypothetical protein [Pseudoalteromonas sp. B95]MDK1286414.1 hypothetical protein [Pseudoalteromonas sp. B95]
MISNLPLIDILQVRPEFETYVELTEKILNDHDYAASESNNTDLDNFEPYINARRLMVDEVPEILEWYQSNYSLCKSKELESVSQTIDKIGVKPAVGQIVFHGGTLPIDSETSSFTTTRPLSTSLSPAKARNNALDRQKAFDRGELNIYIIEILKPDTNIFLFPYTKDGYDEKEVLFAAGLELKYIEKSEVTKVTVYNCDATNTKEIPFNIITLKVQ